MKILFATDGSDYAARAANVLASLKCKESIALHVLTVSYLPDNLHSQTTQSWYPTWRRSEDVRIRNHYEQISDLLESVKGSIHMLQKEGSPTHVILETARELDVDLIVVGARGHTLLDRILMGSVSDSVANHAPCSVLIVRPPESDEGSDPGFDRIMLAYDGSKQAVAASSELRKFGWQDGAHIEVVTVAPSTNFLGDEYAAPVPIQELQMQMQAETVRLKDVLVGDGDQVDVTMVKEQHVGNAIVETAKRSHTDVVVLGESGHSPLGNLLLGSTTKYVMRHAPCSVWISRDKATANEAPGTSSRAMENVTRYART